MTATVTEEYEAWRMREWSQEPVAYRFIATVYEPVRRWGQKTGGRCVGALGEAGRKVWRRLSTPKSESDERCREVGRGVGKRGLPTPVTMTPEGALGLTKALEARWPQSLRSRCGLQKMQKLQQKVPARAGPAVKALVVVNQ